jgi:hypothetical protein
MPTGAEASAVVFFKAPIHRIFNFRVAGKNEAAGAAVAASVAGE